MWLAKLAWTPVAMTVIAVAMGCAPGTASAMVCDDADGIGPITENVNANVTVPSGADCTFGPSGLVDGDIQVEGTVKGNVKVNGGTVTIRGIVDGNIEASESDTITVTGTVDGNIEASVSEMITVTGAVHGNIKAGPASTAQITVDGTVDGNVVHEGPGAIELNGGSVGGNVEMKGAGDVTIGSGNTVAGNVICNSSGNNIVSGAVEGEIKDC